MADLPVEAFAVFVPLAACAFALGAFGVTAAAIGFFSETGTDEEAFFTSLAADFGAADAGAGAYRSFFSLFGSTLGGSAFSLVPELPQLLQEPAQADSAQVLLTRHSRQVQPEQFYSGRQGEEADF